MSGVDADRQLGVDFSTKAQSPGVCMVCREDVKLLDSVGGKKKKNFQKWRMVRKESGEVEQLIKGLWCHI